MKFVFENTWGIEVRQMVRGERSRGHRGGESSINHGVRGSKNERWEPELDLDPRRYPRDDDDELPYTADDEYIWPTPEDEEDD